MFSSRLAHVSNPSLGARWADVIRSLSTNLLGQETLSHLDLTGKTYLVTGSTDGIGRTTASLLAQHAATVLVHGRDATRVRKTLRGLKQDTGNPQIYGYAYDLASLSQTRSFAAHVRKDVERWFDGKLHVLVNNAGVFEDESILTEDGLEHTWAVNMAAPFLLTGELMDLISERVVNVTSISMAEKLNFDTLRQQDSLRGGLGAYSASKLAINMFTYRLARLMKGTAVTVNAIDPGTVSTKLCFAGWGLMADVATPVEVADYEFWAAASPDLAHVSGKYFVARRPRQGPHFSYDKEAQHLLWQCLEQQTGMTYKIPVMMETVSRPEVT